MAQGWSTSEFFSEKEKEIALRFKASTWTSCLAQEYGLFIWASGTLVQPSSTQHMYIRLVDEAYIVSLFSVIQYISIKNIFQSFNINVFASCYE